MFIKFGYFFVLITLSLTNIMVAKGSSVTLKDGTLIYKLSSGLDVLEDPTGNLTIHDVNKPEWSKKFYKISKKPHLIGFSDSTYWARLKVKNFSTIKNWIITHKYHQQDKVSFFKKINGKWKIKETGDTLPFGTREVKTEDLAFEIKPNESLYFIKISGVYNNLQLTIETEKSYYLGKIPQNYILGVVFGILIAMIGYNLFIFLSIKDITYLYYVGTVVNIGLYFSNHYGLGIRFIYPETPFWSQKGHLIFANLFFCFMTLFSSSFLNLKESKEKLYRVFKAFSTFYFLMALFALFNYKYIFITYLVSTPLSLSLLILGSVLRYKDQFKPARFLIYSSSVFLIGWSLYYSTFFGLIQETFLTKNAFLISILFQSFLLSMSLTEKLKFKQEEYMDKEKTLKKALTHEKLQAEEESRQVGLLFQEIKKLNSELSNKLHIRSKETKELLDNIEVSVFSINEEYKVLPPVSKYSEKIFGINIVGKNVMDFLYYNIKKGTKEYTDLVSVFSIIFGSDEIQFFILEEKLPHIVQLPHSKGAKEKTLKLSYSVFYDDDDLVNKLMCVVEDVTDSEEHFKKTKENEDNFKFLSEIIGVKNKKVLAKNIEESIKYLFEILEDFVSPISDTYNEKFFLDKIDATIKHIQKNIKGLNSLEEFFKDYSIQFKISFTEKKSHFINPQVEATSRICDILDVLLKYASCTHRFTPVTLNFDLSLNNIISEKIKDINKIFKNFFEYIFLVRDIDQITDERIKNSVNLAKLYPDFDRTIDLIQQRSRLLSFLLKGIGENELSEEYKNLSSQIKKMPEHTRIDEFMIKRNLLTPYKEVLEKTKNFDLTLKKAS